MDTQNFIKYVVDGDALNAKEVLNNILSSKAFEGLDVKKQELAKTFYNGREIDSQDED